MFYVTLAAQLLLLVWFFGCICTYRIGARLLVEGEGVKSPEFVMLCLYGCGMVLFYAAPAVGRWWLCAVLTAWIVIQFFCHWFYTLFGASEKKLKGYNECFKETIRLIPASEKRLIPDLYHMILHLLLALNLALALHALLRG